jgi:hypothetical protein
MKLTDDQVSAVERQTGAQPIPADNPAVEQLQGAFGEHTFYADANGLHVIEPVGGEEAEPDESRVAIVQIAEWADGDKSSLAPVEPRALGALDLNAEAEAPAPDGGGDAA